MAAGYIQDEAEFDTLLSSTPLLVVDCTAAWCGPCKVISPLVDQLAEAYSEQAKVLKLDLDTNQPVAKRFGVRSIPAIMFFKQGELVETLIGVKPYEELSQALDRHLEPA
ncbi:thioredoxin [Pseudanabaena sp. FACHB-2040]|uniref:thioredoxin n=1 Tax=Pseudanabaena sp. FACHB-2040 TaxID=2692859 RepID=UPI001686606B|nr:thioredoxin [Pseudanabaena sp. FACHB-2040]MBD2260933.1 thioredoxin [Pseudanabaena sp. FACHB-2040]